MQKLLEPISSVNNPGEKNRCWSTTGAFVDVRSWEEISATLDHEGRLDGLPFMPEMLDYCGTGHVVRKRLERTCEEVAGGMRRIRNVVFLEGVRCDGSAHGGCQKGCMIFWRDEWLRKAPVAGTCEPKTPVDRSGVRCPTASRDGEYTCQSTELLRATKAIPVLDLKMYLRDIRARTYTVWGLVRVLAHAWHLRLRWLATGKSYRVVEGDRNKTPIEILDLKPGELVRVKAEREIAATLDRTGKNRGLSFTVEMVPCCGKTFTVLRRIERSIHEPTRRLIELKHTVILKGVTCDGCHILRGGCPRETFHFWREAWLTRLEDTDARSTEGRSRA